MAKKDDKRLKLVEERRAWADLTEELLHEILSRVFAGDRVMFHSVCKLWNSITLIPSKQGPLTKPDCFHPYLLSEKNENIFHPTYGDLHRLNFPDVPGTAIRAARDGWLLLIMDVDLYFYNPFTETKVKLPLPHAGFIRTQYVYSSPTSKDWFVVTVVTTGETDNAIYSIYSIRSGDENWTWEHSLNFNFSFYNTTMYKGMYYFLGNDASLLIYDPNGKTHAIYESPESVSRLISPGGEQNGLEWEQYMLESEGELWYVFVGEFGNPVHVFRWNDSIKTWETLETLGNKMLFVSGPLSLTLNATVKGTENKIYFPRFIGKHCLFYSLATKKYHTFEMGVSRQGFEGSEFSVCATWIMQ